MLQMTGAMMPAEFIDEPRTTREAFPAKFAGCDPRVPYGLLEQAKQLAVDAFPDAARVVPLWTPSSARSEIHVEIWDETNRRARVVSADALAA